MMHAVTVSWAVEAPTDSSRARSGSAGRYMSIDTGAIAVSAPRITSNRALVPVTGLLRIGPVFSMTAMAQSTQDRAEARTGLFIGGEARPAEDAFPVFDPADPESV